MRTALGILIRLLVLAIGAWPEVVAAQSALCQGQPVTIFGTAGDDPEIRGTIGNDVIAGLDGDDIIHGDEGADVICGGPGADVIHGNRGKDSIEGNRGADILLGGRGDDLLKGGKGNDSLIGGGGANTCVGGPGINSFSECEPAPAPAPAPQPAGQVPADFAGVVWLHTDVSSWAVTTPLEVSFGNGLIRLDYEKANVWPANGEGLNGNPWIFVFQDGTWYAATWEWLRFGQTAKSMSSVAGDHIKKAPLLDFRPVSGQIYGFMVSGLARSAERNVLERTPVVMVAWP